MPTWLEEEVERDLFQYLGAGQLGVASEIAGVGGLRVERWRTLLEVAFLVSEEVGALLDLAASQMHRLLPASRRERQCSDEFRSTPIHWPSTFSERFKRGGPAQQVYVSYPANRTLDRPENIILKATCEWLWQTFQQHEGTIFPHGRGRASGWRLRALSNAQSLTRVRSSIVYRLIPSAGSLPPSDRLTTLLLSSRRRLYRDLGRVARLWRRVFPQVDASGRGGGAGSPVSAAERLLQATIVRPNSDRLLELYVLFRVIRSLFCEDEASVLPIAPGLNPVAEGLVAGNLVRVFFQGSPGHVRIGNTSPQRRELATVFSAYGGALGSGIPDVCVERVGKLARGVVLECKNTQLGQTVASGLTQCQRYRDNWESQKLPAQSVCFQVIALEWAPGWVATSDKGQTRFELALSARADLGVADVRVVRTAHWGKWLRQRLELPSSSI